MNIDKDLLREQIAFIYKYAWREHDIPDQMVGVLNLLESLEGED